MRKWIMFDGESWGRDRDTVIQVSQIQHVSTRKYESEYAAHKGEWKVIIDVATKEDPDIFRFERYVPDETASRTLIEDLYKDLGYLD